jgi:hypothetical protein
MSILLTVSSTGWLLAAGLTHEWDSAGTIFWKLAIIAALVLLNGFFVAAEFALVKVRGSQLETLASEGNKGAAAGQVVLRNLDAYLSACQLGITLASLALGWVGEPYLAQMLQPIFQPDRHHRAGGHHHGVIHPRLFGDYLPAHRHWRAGTEDSRDPEITADDPVGEHAAALLLRDLQASLWF